MNPPSTKLVYDGARHADRATPAVGHGIEGQRAGRTADDQDIRVHLAGGEYLGVVVDGIGDYFKVLTPRGPEWLHRACIRGRRRTPRELVICRASELSAYRLELSVPSEPLLVGYRPRGVDCIPAPVVRRGRAWRRGRRTSGADSPS